MLSSNLGTIARRIESGELLEQIQKQSAKRVKTDKLVAEQVKINKRLSVLKRIIKKLYEDFAADLLDSESYHSMLIDYTQEQKQITARLAVVEAVIGGGSGYAKYKDFGIEKIGKLTSTNHPNEHPYGVKYHYNRVKSHNRRVVNSFELHRPHANKYNKHNKWHWQLNRWKKGKSHPVDYWRIWGKRWK